jgi:uncharacterized protein YkwD
MTARLAAALLGTLLLATAGSVPSRAAAVRTFATASAATPAAATSAAEHDAEALALRLVGEARSEAGLAPLRSSAPVAAIARARAADMRDRGYFAHLSPDGTDAFDLLDRSGLAWSAGSEVIGWNTVDDPDGSAARVVADWLASPEHREILLAGDRDAIGLASVVDASTGRRTWVAVLVAVPPPAPPAVSVRVLRVGRPDSAGTRPVMVAWAPRATQAAPVVSVTVQVRRAGGRWATAFAATARATLRVRVRAPGAFEVRVRARGPGGTTGPWSLVRVRP